MATREAGKRGSREARDLAVVGTARPKVDAHAKCTGQTLFADDLVLPRMLWTKLLRSPHPHARIIRIDVAKAKALPGVHAVITGKDLPVLFGILPVSQDEEALCSEIVRFIGCCNPGASGPPRRGSRR